tara:strand:- start:6274 stop:6663 length:390 start_codon:yes stop_codon:yes gene_type:complete
VGKLSHFEPPFRHVPEHSPSAKARQTIVGKIEGWPMIAANGEIQKIGHGALPRPVEQVAQCAPMMSQRPVAVRRFGRSRQGAPRLWRACTPSGSKPEPPELSEAYVGVEAEHDQSPDKQKSASAIERLA